VTRKAEARRMRPRWRVWRDSVKKDKVEFKPIPRDALWKVREALEERERKTRKPGRHNGEVGLGLQVFDALRSFINWKTGQLTPSVSMIADKANLCPRSVHRAIKALKDIGALDWKRRCEDFAEDGVFCLKQISNGYFILTSFLDGLARPAECPEPSREELGLAPPPLDPPPPDAAEMAAAARSPAEDIAALESERSNELLNSTAVLGRKCFGLGAAATTRVSAAALRSAARLSAKIIEASAADAAQWEADAKRLLAGLNAGKA
jgi:hypothetical protein